MVVGHGAGTGINKMGPPWKVKRESLLDKILGGMQNVTGWFQQIVPPPLRPAGGKLNVTESVRRIADGVSVEWKITPGGVNKSCPPPLRRAGGGAKWHGGGA